jgi:hypothetical protein
MHATKFFRHITEIHDQGQLATSEFPNQLNRLMQNQSNENNEFPSWRTNQ